MEETNIMLPHHEVPCGALVHIYADAEAELGTMEDGSQMVFCRLLGEL